MQCSQMQKLRMGPDRRQFGARPFCIADRVGGHVRPDNDGRRWSNAVASDAQHRLGLVASSFQFQQHARAQTPLWAENTLPAFRFKQTSRQMARLFESVRLSCRLNIMRNGTPHSVLITGAAGHLGGKLTDHLAADSRFKVSGLDIEPGERDNIVAADLAKDGDWVRHLEGLDTIVHLAGEGEPGASWKSAMRNNVDCSARLLHHAAEAGVGRVVLASTNWVHGGYRFRPERLTPELDPLPVNAYGASKLCCERLGAYFAQFRGLSVICMRIGWLQKNNDNHPGPHMDMGRWGQDMWLSDRDFLQGMTASITAQGVDFAILNLMSNNAGMRWDIEPTIRLIGYKPQDSHTPRIAFGTQLKSAALKLASVTVPRFARKYMSSW